MPLTPNSRLYEQKLEQSRKRYESRHAFATERARKAQSLKFSTPAPRHGGHPGLNYAPGRGTDIAGSLSERVIRNYTTDVGDATSRIIQDTFLGGKGKSDIKDYSLWEPKTGIGLLDAAIKYNPTNLLAGNLLNNSDFSQMLAPGDIIPVEKGVSLGLKGLKYSPTVAEGLYRGIQAAGRKLGPEGYRATTTGISKAAPRSVALGRRAAKKAETQAETQTSGKLFPTTNEWTFDPVRIRESAEAATEITKDITRASVSGGKPQRELGAQPLSERGVPDLRDIIYLQNYGSFGELVPPDPEYIARLSRVSPESLIATFLSPTGNVSTTRKTLFAADRFREMRWLDNASTEAQAQLTGIADSPQLQIVRDTLTQAIKEGRLRETAGKSDTIADDFDYFTRLVKAMNPDYSLPRGIKDDLSRGYGLQGEHSSLPVGNVTFAIKELAELGNTKNIEELPALLEAVRLYGLDLGKGLNQGFASLPRVVGGEISEKAPAFQQLKELGYPIMFDRFKEVGGLDLYREDLARQLSAAPNLGPEVLNILDMPKILSALRGRQVARGKPQIV